MLVSFTGMLFFLPAALFTRFTEPGKTFRVMWLSRFT